MILIISDISMPSVPFITIGVIANIPWNKNVPTMTFIMLALLILAPPINIAAIVWKVNADGAV